ncbi:MAG: HepT-like ribonuclease domain-containing protein [Bacteroidia bacterium]
MRERIGDKQRLLHIFDAIEEIENYIEEKNFDDFKNNSMMRNASIKQLEIIGEASNYLSTPTKEKFNTIDWSKIVGLRNILVHEYFGIDMFLIWQIITVDLPGLKSEIKKMLLDF